MVNALSLKTLILCIWEVLESIIQSYAVTRHQVLYFYDWVEGLIEIIDKCKIR